MEIPPDFHATRMDEVLLLRCLVLILTGVADDVKEREGARIEIQGRSDTKTLTLWPDRARPTKESRSTKESRFVPQGEKNEVLGKMGLLLAGVVREMGGDLLSGRGPGGSLILELRLP